MRSRSATNDARRIDRRQRFRAAPVRSPDAQPDEDSGEAVDPATIEGGHIGGNVEPVGLEVEMQRSYLDYAMSVIVGRALPDVRDGLKPGHRKIQ